MKTKRTNSLKQVTHPDPLSSQDESRDTSVRDRIATAAYYLAMERGFEPGREIDDWLAAEVLYTNRNNAPL